jgi:two-component system sensor histidine kinase KdpD
MTSREPAVSAAGAGPDGRPGGDRPAVSRIADVRSQDRVSLTGTIREAGTVTIGTSPAWRCVLADATGELDLLFLGRATVAGLAEGTRCTVEGTATPRQGRLTVWNPRYQVTPARHAPSRVLPVPPDPERTADPAGLGPAAKTSGTALSVPAEQSCAADAAAPGSSGAADVATAADEVGGTVEAAGHFRIYLGAAAGAGKTVAMLDEGQRRRQRGADVVIGFVECHGRPVTQARAAGLETIPRKVCMYRGARFEEMDTAAVLERRPAVALVDELAHTNVPGAGPHGKRWQDVRELLDAGIDVITTVNIQHLESIADTVEEFTGVPVRERVPDWVIRRADQIELIDSSPEQLRRRMLHGNIYPPDKIPQALTHFFRADNLTALRELALRFLADETDEQLLERLARQPATTAPWETAERIMAAVTPAPGAEAIVRRAARMAARIKAGLDIVHITSGNARSHDRDTALAGLRQVSSDVGASWHQLSGDEPVSGLIEFALAGQITQIVVGSSQRSRWRELIGGGSIVTRVSRQATRAGIDVHIVARRQTAAP